MEQQSEQDLLSRLRGGDRVAYEAFVCGYYRRVYALLAHLARDVHLAEDLTQETFVSAWSNIGNFSGRSSLVTWLYRIAYHKLIDARRRELVRSEKTREFYEHYGLQIQQDTALEGLVAVECRRQLVEAVGEMEEDDRVVITLHYFQDLSYRDMAAVLGRPSGTVKWQTSQALQRLKGRLDRAVSS